MGFAVIYDMTGWFEKPADWVMSSKLKTGKIQSFIYKQGYQALIYIHSWCLLSHTAVSTITDVSRY